MDFEREYDFVHAFHQKNSGVAVARQELIGLAQGEFIMFCDADDFFEQDAIEVIYDLLIDKVDKDVGVILFGYNLVRLHGKRRVCGRQLADGRHWKDEFSAFHVKGFSDLYWSSLCNKCYRTDLCRYPKTIKFEKLMEDVIFNIDYFSRCAQIYVIRKALYNYVQIGESLTRTKRTMDSRSIEETRHTYLTLNRKTLDAYPEEKEYIKENEYIMIKRLMERAHQIGDRELYEKFDKKYENLKKELGISAYRLDCRCRLRDIKRLIKKLLRYK